MDRRQGLRAEARPTREYTSSTTVLAQSRVDRREDPLFGTSFELSVHKCGAYLQLTTLYRITLAIHTASPIQPFIKKKSYFGRHASRRLVVDNIL